MDDSLFSYSALQNMQPVAETSALLATNEKSAHYGLLLTEQEAAQLVQANREALRAQERIEFGKSILVKLAEVFMHSAYLSQSDYASTLMALLDIFYEAKEESLDILTDDEVIEQMYSFFEQESGGNLEVLQTRDMEALCRSIRDLAYTIRSTEEDVF